MGARVNEVENQNKEEEKMRVIGSDSSESGVRYPTVINQRKKNVMFRDDPPNLDTAQHAFFKTLSAGSRSLNTTPRERNCMSVCYIFF